MDLWYGPGDAERCEVEQHGALCRVENRRGKVKSKVETRGRNR